MTTGSVFFRSGTRFPRNFSLPDKPSYAGWTNSEFESAHKVDQRIRELGWHFMWLALYSTRIGVGRSRTSALDKAIRSGLEDLKPRFNTAELMDVRVRKYPGFYVAKVKLAARHIQEWASLGLVDEAVFRIAPDLVNG